LVGDWIDISEGIGGGLEGIGGDWRLLDRAQLTGAEIKKSYFAKEKPNFTPLGHCFERLRKS